MKQLIKNIIMGAGVGVIAGLTFGVGLAYTLQTKPTSARSVYHTSILTVRQATSSVENSEVVLQPALVITSHADLAQ